MSIRSCIVRLAAAAALAATLRADGPGRRELATFFRPYRTTEAALSPDGRHLAYTVRDDGWLNLILLDLDHPTLHPAIVLGEAAPIGPGGRLTPVTLSFLQWADAGRIIYAVTLPSAAAGLRTEVRIANADTSNQRTLVDTEDVAAQFMPPGGRAAQAVSVPRPLRVVGFLLDAAHTFAVEATGNADVPTELFAVNLETTIRTSLAQVAEPGRVLYDREGHPRILETPRVPPRPVGDNGAPAAQPQVFRYRPADGSAWVDLDAITSDATRRFRNSDTDYFQPRSVPLGFGRDGNVLYFASDVGHETFGVYALDLALRRPTSLAVENATADVATLGDEALVFDRSGTLAGVRFDGLAPVTQWLSADAVRLQHHAERAFPTRRVELVDWDDAGLRAVMLVAPPAEPGRYYVLEIGEPDRVFEVSRRAPWLTAESVATAVPFQFASRDGAQISGTLLRPRRARMTPPPLVLICPDLPASGPRLGYAPEAQALAALGYMVADVNYRGTGGMGRRHRDAVRAAPDRSAVADVQETIAWLATQYPHNRGRVALLGRGFGGYVALRALELFPNDFRAAVAIDAPLDAALWLSSTGVPPLLGPPAGSRVQVTLSELPPLEPVARRREFFGDALVRPAASVLANAAMIARPVCLLQNPAPPDLSPAAPRQLQAALHQRGLDAEFLELSGELAGTEPEAQARVMARIGEFLDATMYDFGVRIGELREVK